MDSVKVRSHVGTDGVLTLQIPTGLTDATLDVFVVFQPVATPTLTERGWPSDFFAQTAGAWAGEPLVRGEQGSYEVREELFVREATATYQQDDTAQ